MRQRTMFFSLCFLCFTFFSSSARAQNDTTKVEAHSVNTNSVFEKAEKEASVDMARWRHHLEIHLMPVIEAAANRGMKPGNYTVNVRFLVGKDGTMSDVKALNDPGYGLAQSAVRVVQTGPLWDPGEVKGQKVRSYHTQPITFQIQVQ